MTKLMEFVMDTFPQHGSGVLVLLTSLEFYLARLAMLPSGLDSILPYVNQAICIFILVPIVFCNLVSIKCIIAMVQHGTILHGMGLLLFNIFMYIYKIQYNYYIILYILTIMHLPVP